MTKAVGLWIDHRKAVIVAVTDRGETTSLIVSRVEKQLGRFAGVRSMTPYEPQQVPADDTQERKFHGHLAVYYDAVIASIRDAESILIFGPGEAKIELEHRLKKARLGGRIVGIETIDKMTDRQIAAKVWQRFSRRQQPAGGSSGRGRMDALRKNASPGEPKTMTRRSR